MSASSPPSPLRGGQGGVAKEISVWLSVDPKLHYYPMFTPYGYSANNPVVLIDPDGKKIRPITRLAMAVMNQLKNKYGGFLKIGPERNEPDVFKTSHYFKDFSDFTREFNKYIKDNKGNCEFKKKDLLDAWKLYNALYDDEIIEVSMLLVEGESGSSSIFYEEEDIQDGSKYSGKKIRTDNAEYQEFVDMVKYRKRLNQDIADALWKGSNIVIDGNSYQINSDSQGDNWVFFRNFTNSGNSRNRTKGHIVINATELNNSELQRIIIDSTSSVSD